MADVDYLLRVRRLTSSKAFALALVGIGCGRHEPAPAPQVSTSAASSAAAQADAEGAAGAKADAAVLAVPSALGWADAIRLERWDEAERGLDALSDADKARADIRYARARTAIARGDAPGAIALLQGLDTALPLLAEDVARYRAEAKLLAGPFVEAAEYFASRQSAGAQMKAAEAYDHAGDAGRARAACDRVVGSQKRTRAQEAEARAMRLRLAQAAVAATDAAPKPALSKAALDDARWLVIHASSIPASAGVDLAKLDPSHPLTAQELMERASVLDDAGQVEEALRAIDDSTNAPGTRVPQLERLRAKGYLLYHHARYFEASKALAECAAVGGKDAAEDAFHSARALSRADKDDDAIAGYEGVTRRYPRSTWGDRAAFFVPYLHMLHGEWKDAERGFDEYAKHYPDGNEKDAPRHRALAHLMTKDWKTARRLYERLSGEEADAQTSARLANMAALAALGDGDKTHAIARWTEVARSRPLSYAALVARARLAQQGAPVPPQIDAAEAGGAPQAMEVALPPPVDVLHAIGLDGDAENALHDREPSVTAGTAGRGVEALCSAYGKLGRARRRYLVSQNIPVALLTTAPGTQNRWAWDCVYPSPYLSYVRDLEAKEGLRDGLVYAVMRQESAYDPDAVSGAHAVGLLQLVPETAKTLAEELGLSHDDARLTSPPYNLALGAHYLRGLVDRFHGQLPLAIAAYNCGPEAVARWASRSPGMDLDVYVERIPYKETRDYVGRVMGNLARYAYMEKGEAGVPAIDLALGQ